VEVNRPLGIITPSDFVGYLKENLNIDDINAKILDGILQYKYEINDSASFAMPSTLSCSSSRSSNSDVVQCINDFSDSAEVFDFVVSFSISEDEELLLLLLTLRLFFSFLVAKRYH
jgi:hypothetical protein